MTTTFRNPVILGRTGLRVGRLGIGSSYGVPAAAIERAYREYGVNYLYWGSLRVAGMREAIRHLARTDRERLVIALQSYDRTGRLMPVFLDRGLRALRIDFADVLILGLHNREPSARVLDAARSLQQKGRVRFLAISGHHRPLFGRLAGQVDCPFDIFMLRYNAAHRGAEAEAFPFLPGEEQARGSQPSPARPGVIAYTATRWGTLLKAGWMPPGERPLTAAQCYRFVLSNRQ